MPDFPPISEVDWRHILDGEPDSPKLGGHRFGTGRNSKTEFPEAWSDEDIKLAVPTVRHDLGSLLKIKPHSFEVKGVYLEVGITVRTWWSDELNGWITTAFPLGGPGVVRNEEGRQVSVALPRNWPRIGA